MATRLASASDGRDEPTTGSARADRPLATRIINLVSADLTAEREKWLMDGLVAALPSLRMAELFAQRRTMLRDVDLVTIAVTGNGDGPDEVAGSGGFVGDLVGFLASKWTVSASDEEFLHITSQFVAEGHRYGRVFRSSWAAHFSEVCRRQGDCPRLSVLKTCNPEVYCAMRVFTRLSGITMFPDIDAPVQDPDLTIRAGEIARAIAPEHRFSGRTGIIHGVGVPEDLYPTMPLAADQRVNDYFTRTTGPTDRMLCMLSIPSKAIAERVLRALGAPEMFAETG